MENELLPIVDTAGNVIGKTERSVLHAHPELIHPVIHCWLLNKEGQILIQKRSLKKVTKPGIWDMSCGGHIHYGETVSEGLHRELAEELGITNCNPTFVKSYLAKDTMQSELIYLYYLFSDQIATSFSLVDGEVTTVQWRDPYEVQTAYLNKSIEITKFVITEVSAIFQYIFTHSQVYELSKSSTT